MTEISQPTTVENSIALAKTHLEAGRIAQAEAIYRQVLVINPTHFDALYYLGVIATQVDDFEQAVRFTSQAIQQNPSIYTAHNNLGIAYMKQGRYEEAIASFGKALALKQDYSIARINMAQTYQAMGDLGMALKSILKETGFIRFTRELKGTLLSFKRSGN